MDVVIQLYTLNQRHSYFYKTSYMSIPRICDNCLHLESNAFLMTRALNRTIEGDGYDLARSTRIFSLSIWSHITHL